MNDSMNPDDTDKNPSGIDRKAPRAATLRSGKRLLPEEREEQIVEKAIEHFTKHGFSGSTRELARKIGVTQPLLYRYFPSKEALIDRVYSRVYEWNPQWEAVLADTSMSMNERMCWIYQDYARVILREEWIRIFIFAGLTREGINTKYLEKLRTKMFLPVLDGIRQEYGISEPRTPDELEAEIELIWSLHASIFYLGVRKFVYGLPIPKDIDAVVRRKVDAFLRGCPAVIQSLRDRSS
jgi:AcrR family transcriptional regulator